MPSTSTYVAFLKYVIIYETPIYVTLRENFAKN